LSSTLIALDAGTTGVTAVLFDAELGAVARAYREFPQHFPQPGRVEHEAADILAAADAVLAELLEHPRAADAVALGITNQRETIFAVERATGAALARGIVWQDRRTSERCDALRAEGRAEWIAERTGLLLDPYFSATKIEWLLAHEAGLAARARAGEVVFCTVDALLVAHLTGNEVVATDPTNASRTMLYHLERGAWDADLAELFGVDVAWLPEVRRSAGDFGHARLPGGRTLPITGVAGDQQAALFGQGCHEPGGFKITFGTGSFLLLNTGATRARSRSGLLTTVALAGDGSACFALEGSVFMCGAIVQWLRDQLGILESAPQVEELARSVDSSGGVVLVPAFAGLGAPYWDADARAALLGMSRGTSRAHIARAALEAMAFQNAELVELLRVESGLEIGTALVDGGAAANDLLMELQADLAGLTVTRPPSVEATARGAAGLAGVGVGLLEPTGRAAALGEAEAVFAPGLAAAERGALLAGWREAVARVRSA
jgi:glycerol kinase